MKKIEKALLAARKFANREGGMPDMLIISRKNFIKFGVDAGYSRKHMLEVLKRMEKNGKTKTKD